MKDEAGFTLLEIMLVLLLLGITSSLVIFNFPAGNSQLARQGEKLHWMLSETLERAEREGVSYSVVFSRYGWRVIIDGEEQQKEIIIDEQFLPDGFELQLCIEQHSVPLDSDSSAAEQIWLYPGGETTQFNLTLSQGKCRWLLYAPGYFVFDAMDIRCDEIEG